MNATVRAHLSLSVFSVAVLTACTDGASVMPLETTPAFDLTAAAAPPFAYVTHPASNTVSVIETATSSVVATVPVASGPIGVAVSPDGASVYVASRAAGTVSVISTATNTVVATISTGDPGNVVVTPNGAFVYVTNCGANTVSVIATATNTVVATIADVTRCPIAAAITPDGAFTYVANNNSCTVSVIATATNTVTATIDVTASGGGSANCFPNGIAVTPDGESVYVAGGRVSVIEAATNTVVASISVLSAFAVGVAISPDGAFAYVTTANFCCPPDLVRVIQTATNTISATIAVGTTPWSVAFTPDGSFAYVPSFSSNAVSVIETTTHSVTTTIPVAAGPFRIAITPRFVLQVEIDIKPGSDPNCFNADGNGVIPVAIVSREDFAATNVDPSTVQLEGAGVRAVGKSNKLLAHVDDVNADGLDDLVVQIEDLDGAFIAGQTTATLTGALFDGTRIQGTDAICITPP